MDEGGPLSGASASQAIAADDLVEQGPSVVPESVCRLAPKAMQQQSSIIEKGGITSGTGTSKMSR